jgi:uncharacterized protein (DUF885 family)
MNGMHRASCPTFLINFHKVDDEKDYLAYVSRLQKVPVAFDQLLERAQAGIAKGVRPPKFAYEGVIEQSRKVIAGAPFSGGADSALWADAQAKADALAEGRQGHRRARRRIEGAGAHRTDWTTSSRPTTR